MSGIELSAPMVAQLRRKISEDDLSVAIGDMATTRVAGQFSLVFLVWNSISNLRTQAEQVQCFRNAGRQLKPGGRFVIELGAPKVRRVVPGQTAVPSSVAPAHLIRAGTSRRASPVRPLPGPPPPRTGQMRANRERSLPQASYASEWFRSEWSAPCRVRA